MRAFPKKRESCIRPPLGLGMWQHHINPSSILSPAQLWKTPLFSVDNYAEPGRTDPVLAPTGQERENPAQLLGEDLSDTAVFHTRYPHSSSWPFQHTWVANNAAPPTYWDREKFSTQSHALLRRLHLDYLIQIDNYFCT